MKPPNLGADAGGLTAAAVIEALRAVTHMLTPAEQLAIFRIVREGMTRMVPPETDLRLRARIRVARATSPQLVDSMANAMESWPLWQQSANTSPDELRSHRSFEEYRALYEEVTALAKLLGYNLDLNHFEAVRKARVAYRTGRNLGGPEGLIIQPLLDALAPSIQLGKRKRKTQPAGPAAANTKK